LIENHLRFDAKSVCVDTDNASISSHQYRSPRVQEFLTHALIERPSNRKFLRDLKRLTQPPT
jgi:hypothetical protein